jgi:RNA polymerase sigma-70 factor (ECF subfamily)
MSRDLKMLQAIEAVYRERGADFFRFALARTSDPELARDAVQEGFARAIRARRSFRGSGSLEAWNGRCVLNAAYDASQRVVGDSLETQSNNEAPPTAEHPDDEVRGALRQLPRRQRDALFLQVYLDYDYATIGSILGMKVGTVSATLHAARENLMRALQEVT